MVDLEIGDLLFPESIPYLAVVGDAHNSACSNCEKLNHRKSKLLSCLNSKSHDSIINNATHTRRNIILATITFGLVCKFFEELKEWAQKVLSSGITKRRDVLCRILSLIRGRKAIGNRLELEARNGFFFEIIGPVKGTTSASRIQDQLLLRDVLRPLEVTKLAVSCSSESPCVKAVHKQMNMFNPEQVFDNIREAPQISIPLSNDSFFVPAMKLPMGDPPPFQHVPP
ncbi:hypothetical protein G4B88_021047 [Cannabis sativa]|uniref:Uncharacterized protein n=1 Tax=Cannabis sativa TaxID=3483 RepID=A0A7J6HX27_CANSA|nr:hypothetical protein G4B88_021047 [Cannabis sativa]